MEVKKIIVDERYVTKFIVEENGEVLGRAFLYFIYNGLHEEPYGLLEDVFVNGEHRGRKIGTTLVKAIIQEAKDHQCYKLIGTSRHSRPRVHEFYTSLGFKNHGLEFRIDFN